MFDIPFIDTVATGQNIDRLRIENGMSVKDMQMIFGFTTPQAIYKWIHGSVMPTIDNLVILAAMFHVSLDDIVVIQTVVKNNVLLNGLFKRMKFFFYISGNICN